MRKNKRKNKILLLTVILLGVTIGFAALATTLKIDGIANITKPTWSIYWANPVVTTGSVSNDLPTITEDEGDPENTKLMWEVTLSYPGDFYEFTVDAINTGSVDAVIMDILPEVTDGENLVSLPDYVKYTVTYSDGTEVALNQLLEANSSQTYKIRIEYDFDEMTANDINAMPSSGLTYHFSYKVNYGVTTDKTYKPALRVGEYFTLVPDAEEATTDTPGFSGTTPTADQTLWRVINLNADGTYDAIADSASSGKITISGEDGFKYYIAGLQDIASCYAKAGYTIKTRMMGYDGQTPVIQDTYAFNGASYTAPSTTSTSSPTTGNGEEYAEGLLGDTLYLRDYQLVNKTYNNLKTSDEKQYWLASRFYRYEQEKYYSFTGRFVDKDSLSHARTRHGLATIYNGIRSNVNNNWGNYSFSYAVRPIITLKSKIIKVSGEGSKINPYIFE